MTVISKLLILLGSIGTSGVGCYATYNSLFSSSPQVTDQPLNSPEVLDQSLNDEFDLRNVHKDKYLQIDSTLSVENQQIVIRNNYKSLRDEIDNLVNKLNQQIEFKNSEIYNSGDLNKLNREYNYKWAVLEELLPKIKET